jgi:uncharacterized membrane protein (UPF0182 family)
MIMIAFGFWLSRFQLLYSPRGSIYGAGFTDIHIQLPVNTTLSLLALSIAFFCYYGLASGHPGTGLPFIKGTPILTSPRPSYTPFHCFSLYQLSLAMAYQP